MKYLLLILLLALVFFMLGVKRARPPERTGKPATPPSPQPAPPPQDMVSCAHCGLHLPRDEALPGRGGQFCSAAHRAAFETGPGGSA